jgi:SIR2-like domain
MINDSGLSDVMKRYFPVTLVLGAGVSRGRGLPLWSELLQEAWKKVSDKDPYSESNALLFRARQVCAEAGIPAEFIRRLDFYRHPLEYQLGFESIFNQLRWSKKRTVVETKLKRSKREQAAAAKFLSNEQRTSEIFAALLRKILYRSQKNNVSANFRGNDTLSLVAQAVRRSALAPIGERIVTRVITFNVDDILEQNANGGGRLVARPVARSTDIVHLGDRKTIGIYHVHGFVPQDPKRYPYYAQDGSIIADIRLPIESLVFTDEQYWQTVGDPSGFAARVFSQALSGICVFIGLSMTDINLLRWLAQYSTEVKRDFRSMAAGWTDSDNIEFNAWREGSRHYWITDQAFAKDADFGMRVLKSVLHNRGVEIIRIPSWNSEEFRKWWRVTFLSGRGKKRSNSTAH